MNKWTEILTGLLLIILATIIWITNVYSLGDSALTFLKGGIIWMIISLGVMFVLLGIADMKG